MNPNVPGSSSSSSGASSNTNAYQRGYYRPQAGANEHQIPFNGPQHNSLIWAHNTTWAGQFAYPGYQQIYQQPPLSSQSQPTAQPAAIPTRVYNPIPLPPPPPPEVKPLLPPRTPTPELELPPHWDVALTAFLKRAGLTQALSGFKLDILTMNPDWERVEIPKALDVLLTHVQAIRAGRIPEETQQTDSTDLDVRKLDHIDFVKGTQPQTHTSLNKSISNFLAQSRARNVASNRTEFLKSMAQKRVESSGDDAEMADANDDTTCARTDAKIVDRDVQMKYDIAKNEDGPLKRTKKPEQKHVLSQNPAESQPVAGPSSSTRTKGRNKAKAAVPVESQPSPLTVDPESLRKPGLEERLQNVETHLAVRFVPSAPQTFLARLKFLEDHIIRLEKEYPPWAALHFNQPHRGWPPPPRSTPIIVPPTVLRTTETQPAATTKSRQNVSSLQRAVMDRLEVKKALNDLAKPEGGTPT